MHRRSEKIASWLAAALVLIQACSKQAPQKPFVARVDQVFLTEEELAAAHDTLNGAMLQRREYVNEWVNTELLYQEAQRRGLADNPQLKRQIESARKKFTIAALLEEELYGEENVSEDEIVALYNGGGDVFRLREDVVNGSFALFGDRDAANAFRGKLVGGAEWNVAVAEVQKDSLIKSHLQQVATRQYFTQSNLYPAELWKIVRGLGKDEVSFAVKSDAGYYVVVTHNIKKQGETPELDYIRNEIRDRILIERRRLRYEKLLTSLRTKHAIEVRLANDDTSTHTNE